MSDAVTLWRGTYCDEPNDAEDFDAWRATFTLDSKAGEVEDILVSNSFMRELQSRIVPLVVEYDAFWTRYFYRLHKLKIEFGVDGGAIAEAKDENVGKKEETGADEEVKEEVTTGEAPALVVEEATVDAAPLVEAEPVVTDEPEESVEEQPAPFLELKTELRPEQPAPEIASERPASEQPMPTGKKGKKNKNKNKKADKGKAELETPKPAAPIDSHSPSKANEDATDQEARVHDAAEEKPGAEEPPEDMSKSGMSVISLADTKGSDSPKSPPPHPRLTQVSTDEDAMEWTSDDSFSKEWTAVKSTAGEGAKGEKAAAAQARAVAKQEAKSPKSASKLPLSPNPPKASDVAAKALSILDDDEDIDEDWGMD